MSDSTPSSEPRADPVPAEAANARAEARHGPDVETENELAAPMPRQRESRKESPPDPTDDEYERL